MGKSNCQGKLRIYEKKGKTLTLWSNLELAVGDDVVVDDIDVDDREPKLLITDPCNSMTVSNFYAWKTRVK
jgi:hypothetical protein